MCVSTHPVYNCQCYAHVKSAVGEVDSLWTIDEDGVVERFHPVSVTTLETKLSWIIITNDPTTFEKPFPFFSDRVRLKNMVTYLVIVFSKFVHFRVQNESLKGSYCSGICKLYFAAVVSGYLAFRVTIAAGVICLQENAFWRYCMCS